MADGDPDDVADNSHLARDPSLEKQESARELAKWLTDRSSFSEDSAAGFVTEKEKNWPCIVFFATMKDMASLATKTALTAIFITIVNSLNIIWIAHHATENQIAGAALGCSFSQIVGRSVIVGIVASLDTLCGQAWGAGEDARELLGIYLQRSLALGHIVFVILASIFLAGEKILGAIIPHLPEVVRYAGLYIRVYILSLYAIMLFENLSAYLRAQKLPNPATYSVAIAFGIEWAGLYATKSFGFEGAVFSVAFIYWGEALSLIAIIKIFGLHKKTWPWRGLMLSEVCDVRQWKEMVSLAIPSMVMITSEWWVFEIFHFVAGILGPTEIASYGLCLRLAAMALKPGKGAGRACAILVGNRLGNNQGIGARIAWDAAFVVAAIMEITVVSIIYALRNQLAWLLAPYHPKIQTQILESIPIICAWALADGIQRTSQGAIRALGMQKFGVGMNFVSYYLVAIPIGSYLCFGRKMGVPGIWAGMACGGYTAASMYIGVRCCVKWKKARATISDLQKPMLNNETSFTSSEDAKL